MPWQQLFGSSSLVHTPRDHGKLLMSRYIANDGWERAQLCVTLASHEPFYGTPVQSLPKWEKRDTSLVGRMPAIVVSLSSGDTAAHDWAARWLSCPRMHSAHCPLLHIWTLTQDTLGWVCRWRGCSNWGRTEFQITCWDKIFRGPISQVNSSQKTYDPLFD